ncbi:MAG: response regulator [Burkholderiales bacterium]|nr:response regulator [Burkholderiales bacterium]
MRDGKPTFYVIDDDSVLRKLISGILRDVGLELLGTGETGEIGLKECHDKHPDLVLLDINLPGSSGFDVLASLKRMRKAPRVVMITSEATMERVKAAVQLGADSFVVKPFTSAKLLGAVESVLKIKLT